MLKIGMATRDSWVLYEGDEEDCDHEGCNSQAELSCLVHNADGVLTKYFCELHGAEWLCVQSDELFGNFAIRVFPKLKGGRQ